MAWIWLQYNEEFCIIIFITIVECYVLNEKINFEKKPGDLVYVEFSLNIGISVEK